MPILKLPISIGDRSASDTDYRDNLLVNYTLVARDVKDDKGYVLSHPGLTAFGTAIDIDRGAIWNSRQDAHLRVSGKQLISVDSVGAITQLGAMPGTSQVSLPYSFQTQGILSDNRFFLFDGTILDEVIDPDLGAPIDAEWINGVYFFTDGETLFHTRADDEKAIDPLTFATSEFSPDRTLGVLRNKQNQMVVFNRYSTEWFTDQSTANFRFRRIEGKSVKVGIVGTHCKTEMNGQIFILGNRKEEAPSIHILANGSEQTIATREIDKILSTYTENELALTILEARVEDRDKFIVVRLLRNTLLFNLTIAAQFGNKYGWTIVKSDVLGDKPWRATNGVYDPRISKWIYGDSLDSRLGLLDNTTNLQYGDKIEEIFHSPIINLMSKSINGFEIDSLPGFANAEVNMFFSISYDGVTYGKEQSVVVSRPNNFNIRFISRRLGYVRYNFNFKFRTVSDGRTALGGLTIQHD